MTERDPTTLVIKRTINAPVSAVYEAWTKPEIIAEWFGPSVEMRCQVHEADVRQGGKFDFEMKEKSGDSHRVCGIYKDVVENEKLVFTWAWITTPERESLVTVDLRGDGEKTLLTLTHARFADQVARDNHAKGWNGSLDRLARKFGA